MDKVILMEKLESLRRCLVRIEEKRPASATLLANDLDSQDILVLNLSRAVQLCVDIGSHIASASEEPKPKTMGDVFTTLQKLGAVSEQTSEQMRKAIGFRNIAVHNYEAMNWDIVFAICEKSTNDFGRYAKEINAHITL